MQGNQMIVFRVGQEEYAIDSLDVIEIDRMNEIKINIVPKVPPYVEGIINLRGDVVPVIDLKKKFGWNTVMAVEKGQRIIIIRASGVMIGLRVDSVSGVEDPNEFEMLPPTEEMAVDTKYIAGIAKRDNRVVFLLDGAFVAR